MTKSRSLDTARWGQLVRIGCSIAVMKLTSRWFLSCIKGNQRVYPGRNRKLAAQVSDSADTGEDDGKSIPDGDRKPQPRATVMTHDGPWDIDGVSSDLDDSDVGPDKKCPPSANGDAEDASVMTGDDSKDDSEGVLSALASQDDSDELSTALSEKEETLLIRRRDSHQRRTRASVRLSPNMVVPISWKNDKEDGDGGRFTCIRRMGKWAILLGYDPAIKRKNNSHDAHYSVSPLVMRINWCL